MTTILSTPTTVTVNPPSAPGTPALGPLAASMAPGTWAQLTVSNQNAILGVGPSTGSRLPFCNAMPWNPVSKVIEIVAGDHAGATPSMAHVRYNESNNLFNLVQAAPAVPGIGHGYDHSAVNPYTGDLYHRLYGAGGSIFCLRKVFGGASFVSIPSVPGQAQVAIGTCWWSGSFIGGGSEGSFMIFNSGNAVNGPSDGQIVAYNPLTNVWFYNQVGKAPFYGSGSTYNSLMEYSPRKNVAVYGGGNVASSKLWRLNSDGSVLAMPNVPSGKSLGVQAGMLVNEPVTGNFLLLSAGQLWELDPDGAGSWTQQTGSRTPASGVGIPGSPNLDGIICCSIPDYGVVAYIKQTAPSGGTFYLYKHA